MLLKNLLRIIATIFNSFLVKLSDFVNDWSLFFQMPHLSLSIMTKVYWLLSDWHFNWCAACVGRW